MTGYVKYAVSVAVLVCMISSVCKGQEKGYDLNEDGVVNIYTSKNTLSIPWGVEYVRISIEKGKARVQNIKTYKESESFENGVKRKIGREEVNVSNELSKVLTKYRTKKIIKNNDPPYEKPQKGIVNESKSFLIVIENPGDMKKAAKEVRKLDGVKRAIPANIKFDAEVGPIETEDIKQEPDTTPNDIEENPNDPRLMDQWSLEKNNKDGTEIQWVVSIRDKAYNPRPDQSVQVGHVQ